MIKHPSKKFFPSEQNYLMFYKSRLGKKDSKSNKNKSDIFFPIKNTANRLYQDLHL